MKKSIFLIFMVSIGFSFSIASASQVNQNFKTHDGIEISGILSYPANKKINDKLPGVLLIHGSGAIDMNAWLPPSITADGKPAQIFKELAEALNAGGAVVYRYNKRGVTSNLNSAPTVDDGVFATGDVNNLLLDVKSALQVLQNAEGVDIDRIFLLGISEGTILAPIVANELKNIKGLIMLSSVGRTMRDILYFQNVERNLNLVRKHIDSDRNNIITETEAIKYAEFSLPIAMMDRNGDDQLSFEEINAVLLDQYYRSINQLTKGSTKKWIESHFNLPANYQSVIKFSGTIFFMHGENDSQTPIEDLYLIERNLKAIKHSSFTIKTYADLGHGFSPNIGPNKFKPTVGPIDSKVLQDLTYWMKNQ